MMVCTHFKKIRRYMWTPFLLHQSQWFSSSSGMPAQQNWTHRRWWEIVKSQSYSLSLVWLFVTPWTVAWEATLSIKFSRQGSGVGCHSFLQGIFLTQELNPGLLYWRQILYHLSHQGSLRILEWVAYIPSPGDLSNPGIEPGSPALQVDSLPAEIPGKFVDLRSTRLQTCVFSLSDTYCSPN